MRKAMVVAQREYRTQVRSRAFVISLVLMPVLMGGGALLPALLQGRVKVEDQHVVVADGTGKLLPALLAAAATRNQREITDAKTGRQTEPRFLLEAAARVPLTDADRFELSQKIRKRALHAFVEIDAAALAPADPAQTKARARVHLEGAPVGGLRRWLAAELNRSAQVERLRTAGLDPVVVARATAPVGVDALGLYTRGSDGRIVAGDERGRVASLFFPLAVVLLSFMAVMMSQTMLQNTLEEKQQRIAEVLLGSVKPGELMLGKVVGSAGVSLTMLLLYLGGGIWTLGQLGLTGLLRHELVAWLLFFTVLGVLIFGSIFTAVGAACNELKEAQAFLLPVMMLLLLPLMILTKIMEAPMSGFSTALSFVPIWTPLLMPLRLAATEAVPLWQPVAGAVGSVLTAGAAIWAGGRVLRVGLLLQGKPPRIGQLIGWILRG